MELLLVLCLALRPCSYNQLVIELQPVVQKSYLGILVNDKRLWGYTVLVSEVRDCSNLNITADAIMPTHSHLLQKLSLV